MHWPEQVFHHARIGSGLVNDIAGSSFEEVLTPSVVTNSPTIAEFVKLKLNSFTLPLRFSEPTALQVIVTSLTVQAT